MTDYACFVLLGIAIIVLLVARWSFKGILFPDKDPNPSEDQKQQHS